jgi:hypothetical protein
MDIGQILPVIVSAILGTASIYSMMQNALMVAVGFMLLLYIFGILFSKWSNTAHADGAKYILVEE